jgi:hypothetical protein
MALPFVKIELRPRPGLRIGRVAQPRLHVRLGHARELAEKFCTPLLRQLGEVSRKIGKVEKGTRGGEILSLEEHGHARPQQHHGR